MPTPTVTPVVAGIDVGKSSLDAHVLPLDRHRSFANDKCGRRAVRNWLLRLGVTRVVFEPTGRYHRGLHQCLFDAGLETVLANPLYARRFAQALGRRAKNDKVDAAVLARYGLLDSLEATPPAPDNLRLLSDLLALRRKLVEHRDALRKLRSEVDCDQLGAPVVQALVTEISRLDVELQAALDADETLARRAAIIRSIPGFGPLNAASLCADMPELGTIGRRQAAALIGVAPFDNQSGRFQGTRRCRGGRAHPRKLLYMAAVSAVRCHAACKALYDRLTAKGRERKVALVAVMRKLLTLVNALLRDNRTWQPEPPPCEALA